MKVFTIAIITFILMAVSLLRIESVQNKAIDVFWDVISYQWDSEEAVRQEKIKKHEVVRGKDTVYIWNNHYHILNHMGEKRFSIKIEDASGNLLRQVSLFDVNKGQFYVISEDGYSVIDKNNRCRVFLLTDRNMIESKYIEYLSSYEDFSERERKHFDKMIKKLK